MPDFTGVYKGRMLAELAYLKMTLSALNDVHSSMDSAIGFTEPALQSAEAKFRCLLQQNIMYVTREMGQQIHEQHILQKEEGRS